MVEAAGSGQVVSHGLEQLPADELMTHTLTPRRTSKGASGGVTASVKVERRRKEGEMEMQRR